MKTISVSVSESDYEAFRREARKQNRPIAQLIREAMSLYRAERLARRRPLRVLPVLAGCRPLGALPRREDLYDEVFDG